MIEPPEGPGLQLRVVSGDDPSTAEVVPGTIAAFERLSLKEQSSLAQRDISYVDVTNGSMRVRSDAPPLYISIRKAPTPSTAGSVSSRSSLSGRAGARIARALVDLDVDVPTSTTSVAALAKISQPQASRLVLQLEKDGALRRTRTGGVAAYDWERVLERWLRDYSPEQRAPGTGYRSLQGPQRVLDALASARDYAVTGDWAAAAYAPSTQPRELTLYAREREVLAGSLGLVPVDRDPDVIVRDLHKDELPVLRSTRIDGVSYCAPAQTIADIDVSRARGDSTRAAMLEWMRRDDSWRN
jgi:hypothetical protein